VSVAETVQGTLGQDSVGLDAAISACVCDTITFKCYNPAPIFGPFSILSLCVFSLNTTAQIDQVSSLKVTQSGTSASLDSICIQTQLYSNFFDVLTTCNKEQRMPMSIPRFPSQSVDLTKKYSLQMCYHYTLN